MPEPFRRNVVEMRDERPLSAIVAEIREELKDFLNTRVQMMKAELNETLDAAKIALPLSAVGAAFLFVGFVMFTLALVALVWIPFAGSPYAWFYAFIIIGFVWVSLGGIVALFALNEFRGRGRFPQRTVQILKADKAWLETEAKRNLLAACPVLILR